MPTLLVGNSLTGGRGSEAGGRGGAILHDARRPVFVLTQTPAPTTPLAACAEVCLSPDPGPLTSDPRLGVTLIEMMVVVAIIGLMIVISFPSVAAGLDSVRLSSATGSVSAFLNAAENRAERRQRPVALVISVKDNLLAMYGNEANSERRLKLPDGITIQAVLPALEGEMLDQPRQLILMPGGTAPAIGIMLANEHGTRRIVRLDPMTGYPHVESVPNK
jgi:prepilin-type N-terminal cleavage/methylation domain-containing protein